jgi:dihydrofolate synthase/folylpolyglutamate synthase
MDVDSSLRKLFSLHNFGIKLGLENTINFLNYLGNPQNGLKTIHIAGSNGKGSTASFIASILQEFGFSTGLYTSPHFINFNERVQINGIKISDEYIAEFVTEHENYIDHNELTFFEVTTVLAFKYFFECGTDYCIIETGLGGRLDATNVLNPLSVIITTISLEHTNILGNTLKQIAFEKAAIIKPNSQVFTGYLKPEAEKIIEEKCKQTGNDLFNLKNFIKDESTLTIEKNEICFDNFDIPLKGKYQKNNAALASLAVTKSLGLSDLKTLKAGIENVIKNTGIQGRYEYFYKDPAIIFDSAHNLESVEKFTAQFDEESQRYSKIVLLFGVLKDKAIEQMLQRIKPYFDEVILTEIDYERSAKIDELKGICEQNKINAGETNDPAIYVRNFMKRDKSDCLVVLGSIYLLGEVKNKLSLEVT